MSLQSLIEGVARFRNKTKIHLMCNWDSSENLTKLWSKMIPPNSNLQLVSFDEAEYYIVINKPNKYERVPPLSKTILMAMEPDWFIGSERWNII